MFIKKQGITLGFGTAMLGKKAAMLCTASVEEVIDGHYKDQTYKLQEDEEELKKKNYKLAILSNGTPSLLNELVKSNNLDTIFNDIFSIEEVKVYKPHPKVYNIPIEKYQIQKNEVAYLSANTWDVSAAGNYGFNPVWVNRKNSNFDKLDYVPKYQIENLSKLIDIV